MSRIIDKVDLVYDNCYNNQQNKTLLLGLGINEDKAKDILINLTLTTKKTSTVTLWINIFSLIIFAILSILFFDYIYLILSIYLFFEALFIYVLIVDLENNHINRNFLNYLLASQLNSIQNTYEFSANRFLKITGKRINDDFSNNSKFDVTNTLLSNNNLTTPPGDTLIPIYERFSKLIPVRNHNDKQFIFTANNSLYLSGDELGEINYYNIQNSMFTLNNTGCYILIVLISMIAYGVVVFLISYHLIEVLNNVDDFDLTTNLDVPLAIFGFLLSALLYGFGIALIWKYKYYNKFIKEYKEVRTKINYKETGVFILTINNYTCLIKVSNFRRENNRLSPPNNNYVNNNTNNNYRNSNLNIEENRETNYNQVVDINQIPERNNSNNESINNIPNSEITNDSELNFSYDYVEQFALKISMQ